MVITTVTLFTLDGNYVGKFGTQGAGMGELSYPTGIAIDMYGFILVIITAYQSLIKMAS